MNIDGLDYNTQREKLIIPEYGREIQNMVDYAMSLTDKNERQHCAESIIAIMSHMFPQNRETENPEQKLWDHLALMSNFKLDIDWPFDISQAEHMLAKPDPMHKIPVRHYGKMVFELFEKLKNMEPGPERDELTRLTANQMKRNLAQWSHSSSNEERVVSDLAKFTDGKIQIDIDTFKFEKSHTKENDRPKKKR